MAASHEVVHFIRVEKNKPFTTPESTGFSSSQAASIIEQLKTGKSVLTRYQEWPYRVDKDTPVDLFGFPQAWEILNKVYESIDAN